MPQIDIRLNSTGDTSGVVKMEGALASLQRGTNKAGDDWEKLGKRLARKFSGGDFAKEVLSGLGIGSGFAIAERAAGMISDYWKEAAETAKSVEESIARQANSVERMLRARRTDSQEIDHLKEEADKKRRAIDELKAPKTETHTVGSAGYGAIGISETTTRTELTEKEKKKVGELTAEWTELDEEIKKLSKPFEESSLQNAVAEFFRPIDEEYARLQKEAKDLTDSISSGVKNYLTTTLKPTLDAEHKLIEARQKSAVEKEKTKSAADDATIARQLADIAERRALIESGNLTTQQEKTAQLLPLIADENRLIADRIALRQKELETAGDDRVRLDLQDKIDALQKELAQNKGKAAGLQTPETLAVRDAKGMRDMGDPSQHYQDVGSGMMGGIVSWLTQVGTLADQVANNLANVFASAAAGISNSIVGLINKTMTWGQALWNIGSTVVQSVIRAFADMAAQWIVKQAVMAVAGKAIQAASVAAMIPLAMASSAIWAAPATLATIATFGGAAAAAPLEIFGAQMAVMSGSLLGFKDGGIIPAGERIIRVNEGGGPPESVLNSGATAALGADAIAALNRGDYSPVHSMTRPAYRPNVGAPAGGSGAASGGPAEIAAPNVYLAFHNTQQDAESWLRSQGGRRFMIDFIRQNRTDLS